MNTAPAHNRGRQIIHSPASTLSRVWSFCSFVASVPSSIISILSIIRNYFNYGYGEFFTTILEIYEGYRDYLFSFLPFEVSEIAKDCILLYLLIGISYGSALRIFGQHHLHKQAQVVLTWPRALPGMAYLISRIGRDVVNYLLRRESTWRGRRFNAATLEWEPVYGNYLESLLNSNHRYHFLALLFFACYIISAFLSVVIATYS